MKGKNSKCMAYVGTYTSGESEGIYVFEVDSNTGSLKLIGAAGAVSKTTGGSFEKLRNPSYQVLSSNFEYLYSVLEIQSYGNKENGAVAAFKIDKETGIPQFINCQSAGGKAPCHISTNKAGTYIFAANYADGTAAVFPVLEDGSLSEASCVITHQGFGPNKERQEKAHTHFVSLTPDEKFLCAVDLGIDRIMVYRFDNATGKLYPALHPEVVIRPGSGPRHIVFHPSGEFAYLINELSSDIVSFEYSSEDGSFSELQYISTLPEGYNDINYCAAIHVSDDGQYLYGSNRGHDSIAIFKIDSLTGKLALIDIVSTFGSFPRDFQIEPSGKYLYVANQNSNTIVTFRIIPETGIIEATGDIVTTPSPVCIKFAIL